MVEYPFTWVPGWSFSRMRTFRTCLRQYWYQYYAPRVLEGSEKRKVQELRSLSSVNIEVGNAVHNTIAEVIKDLSLTGRFLGEDEVLEIAENKFRVLISNKPMFEDRYGQTITDDRIDEAVAKVRTGISGFYSSRWPALLNGVPPGSRGEWAIDPPGYGEFRFEGRKAYAKPDLVFRAADGTWHVVDWKTGKPGRDGDILQVQSYMYFTKVNYGIPLEEMAGTVEYLASPSVDPVTIEGTLVDGLELRNRIIGDMDAIESMCVDVENNRPRPVQEFGKTETERTCGRCNYREVCAPNVVQSTLDV